MRICVHSRVAFVSNPPDSFTLAGVFHNLIPVTLGNVIGGGVLMGWMYDYVNKPNFEEK
ncbi:formate/nitrite transporter FocA (FNT family) [Metabacillus niabensis]|uniref:Formate/nitrite transporter FocA (FNT family) n=1 Tax=Metabacillus niabensis TaxID=324854 RepID=A0ABT9YUV9_9BACI|nr:formate/nitrite transporter FocA (FNT family) [Metabacillus niabensis]